MAAMEGTRSSSSSNERLGREPGVRRGCWCARIARGRAIYSRAREAVAECRRSSSAKAPARLNEHGRAREGDEEGNGRATEAHRVMGAEGAEEKRSNAIKALARHRSLVGA